MRIRYKVLFTLILIIVTLMASLYIVAEAVMVDSINASEKTDSIDNTNRVVTNLKILLSSLSKNVNDWARWDDSYQFVVANNSDFVEFNLLDDTFENLELNMMIFFDTSQELVFAKFYDLENQSSTPFRQESIDDILKYRALFENTSKPNLGIVLLEDKPLLVASHPILTSLVQGPSRGTLCLGRYLDTEELESLSNAVGLPVSISVLDNYEGDADFLEAQKKLTLQTPTCAIALNETVIAGYVMLEDVEGNPAVIARVLDVRSQYVQGRVALTYISFALVVIGLVTLAAVTILLDKLVVSKVSQLSSTVSSIRKTGDHSKRVQVNGKDEVSSLSENINNMLDVIDKHTVSLENTVTERTRELYANQEKLKTILSASPDAILAIDAKGVITESNQQMTKLSGFDREQLLGSLAIELLAEKDQNYLDKLATALSEKGSAVRLEAHLKRKDQTQFPAEVSVNGIIDEQGVHGFVAIIRDLSERKELEQRLFKSERLAAIGELAGMVGHDLRNPLTAIRNASYVIKKKCSGCKEPQGLKMLEIMDTSIDHSNKIINDLLDYAREIHLQPTECSIQKLLREALMMTPLPSNVSLVDQTSDISLKVDESKVIRVFTNLIKNCIDAMPDGGKLQISSSRENGKVSIAFSDTGVGVSPEVMPQLFVPLFTTKAKGMGFGLSISKRIVEAHGGQIALSSTVGKGTICTVTFPENPVLLGQPVSDWIIDSDLP